MLKKNFYLFDLDGVLIGSINNMKLSWATVKKKFNLKNSFKEYSKYIGLPFNDILKKLKINKKFSSINKEYSKTSIKNLDKIKFYKGAIKTIDQLIKRGNKVGILTSKDKFRTNIILGKKKYKFKIIICPSRKYKSKPNAEILNKNLKKIKYNKKRIHYVGDTHIDQDFAKKAKINFIFAKYGYGKLKNKNKYSISKIENLLNLDKKFNQWN